MQANTITFNDLELHAVLINHTRYCLTRCSYAVGECCDLLKAKWSQIPENTQTIIRRDIKEAIEHGDWMDKCDRSSWESLLQFIDLDSV
jgi:hypothetical protein